MSLIAVSLEHLYNSCPPHPGQGQGSLHGKMVQNFIDHLVLSFIHQGHHYAFSKISLENYITFIQNLLPLERIVLLNNLRTKAASEQCLSVSLGRFHNIEEFLSLCI